MGRKAEGRSQKADPRTAGNPSAIRFVQRFDAPAARVFDAWIDPAVARRWLFAKASRPLTRARIDARAGRSFSLEEGDGGRVVWTGKYFEVARPRRLVFDYSCNGRATRARINVEIVPLASGCELRLTHEGAPPGLAGGVDGRWAGMLYGLAETLRRRDA
jgi:uncharacterized protein YndB with AHSA1/START domain